MSSTVIEPEKVEDAKPRKIVRVSKMGSDHSFANFNNHDFAFNLLNMKVVMDGCGSGKYSEVGTRLFGQLFARYKCQYRNVKKMENKNVQKL